MENKNYNWRWFKKISLIILIISMVIVSFWMCNAFFGKIPVTTTAINIEIGTVINALIIGFFAYKGAELALKGVQEQNRFRVNIEVLSKNRQDWINDLRKHMAEYIDLFNSVDRAKENTIKLTNPLPIDDAKTINDIKNKTIALYYYIILLVSNKARTKNDKVTDNFIIMLDLAHHSLLKNDTCFKDEFEKINNVVNDNNPDNTTKYTYDCSQKTFDLISEQLNICTQKLLKQEWERVKNGE